MNPLSLLKASGLSEKEANVYLQLLRQGEQSVADLSKALTLSVSTVDYLCKHMASEGLTQANKKGKFILWKALPLENIMGSIESNIQKLIEKKAIVNQAVLTLSRERNLRNDLPKVSYAQGNKEVLKAYQNFFNSTPVESFIYGYLNPVFDEEKESVQDLLNSRLKMRLKRGLHLKCISSLTPMALKLKKNDPICHQETLLVAKKKEGAFELLISDESVLEVIYAPTRTFSILIKNSDLTTLRREMFLLAWRHAKDEDARLKNRLKK